MIRCAVRWRFSLTLLLLALLAGCAGGGGSQGGGGRYAMDQDAYPDTPKDVANVPDAVPRVEPRSRSGNRSTYTVWGKTYHVLDDPAGYEAEGLASWYGVKFQGYDTANGETYDMYQMSAAHRSLPLPTYARVTNLDNGRKVIVRVNDRGPFHSDRLIDLSKITSHLRQGNGIWFPLFSVHVRMGGEDRWETVTRRGMGAIQKPWRRCAGWLTCCLLELNRPGSLPSSAASFRLEAM